MVWACTPSDPANTNTPHPSALPHPSTPAQTLRVPSLHSHPIHPTHPPTCPDIVYLRESYHIFKLATFCCQPLLFSLSPCILHYIPSYTYSIFSFILSSLTHCLLFLILSCKTFLKSVGVFLIFLCRLIFHDKVLQ